jgi:hypothetical protein
MRISSLHQKQFSYRPGRSCEAALHQLGSRIEVSVECNEIALGAFLDTEGAFNNTSFDSMISAAQNADPTISKWVHTLLRVQTVTALLLGVDMAISAAAGCPQGGVLSPSYETQVLMSYC